MDDLDNEAQGHLRALTGAPSSVFRQDQLEVIRKLVSGRERVLLVQRTGWGKSAVYFIATKMLRERGLGPTLLVSPLLALMRNQIAAANRMGLHAVSINSSNSGEWDDVMEQLQVGAVDLLLISPERLANAKFRRDTLPTVGATSGLLVVDEAHCISDWGHDFRPDYQRIVRVLDLLPRGAPVLCCTATANDRVIDDITGQLGSELRPVRGPLGRDGLSLRVLSLPARAQRLAWLSEALPQISGAGIIYCLTVDDTKRVAEWLQRSGIDAVAYSGGTDTELRERIEQQLLDNELKVVVATSALGMGFDKSDLAFVIHFQSPGSPIAYYQQVGRAGRGLAHSHGILLCGSEDEDINNYFINTAFPSPDNAERLVGLVADSPEPLSRHALMESVNIRAKAMDLLLKALEIDGAIERQGSAWIRTLRPWQFDHQRVSTVTAVRRDEHRQMADYRDVTVCRMQTLRSYLDDHSTTSCGICDLCSSDGLSVELRPELVQEAADFLRRSPLSIKARAQLPDRSRIDPSQRCEQGRSLTAWRDGGWGELVNAGKSKTGAFDEALVQASVDLYHEWTPTPAPQWVTYVPSTRHPELVPDFARRLAAALGLECLDSISTTRVSQRQRLMQNSVQQHRNVAGSFAVTGPLRSRPVLLVDDIVHSRWTLTEVSRVLRSAGVSAVHPFVLTDAAGRS